MLKKNDNDDDDDDAHRCSRRKSSSGNKLKPQNPMHLFIKPANQSG